MDNSKLNQIAGMLDQARDRIAEFRKDTYVESFQKYLEKNISVWNILADTCNTDIPERDEECAQVAECLVYKASEMLEEIQARREREAMRLDLSLYMVSFFLPALLDYQRICGGKEEAMKKLTDEICGVWGKRLGQHIQASDYGSIQAGFKQKLCFVTTAVCCGLHKPQDCREIELMKRYRDEYLFIQQDGEALIKEYYDIAPTIVKRIAQGASPEEKYLYLWEHYISRCISFVENHENERCRQLYEAMMSELRAEYMVTDHERERDRR